jgi:hypothetical protein
MEEHLRTKQWKRDLRFSIEWESIDTTVRPCLSEVVKPFCHGLLHYEPEFLEFRA